MPDLTERLTDKRYPRSSQYDPRWVIDHQMGPHPLWLLEWLAPALGLDSLPPRARVLDLGCGRALTSVFLAREYDVQVTAADLWIKPDENAERLAAAGVADRVLPVHAEAHDLPFGEGIFDAIVSIDAYHYFGTDDLYLPTVTRLLKPGGRIGVVVPALREEPEGTEPPEHLKPFWEPAFWSLHSPAWWHRHWIRSGAVTVEAADWQPDGWRDWLRWTEVCAEESPDEFMAGMARREVDMLRADAGRALGFVGLVGQRTS
ncbi:methyltransferase domain-containing protein [Streptomyces spinoverrucosus]|uniref:SAM-dependent methyltransferase n=1 Tax=Streptomyces spinoverrucosus TaxID=284043 RepID=UPI0018C3AD9B|nr:methyltransferase domain-containing protein [Streptomyces spinoverrucosus]MBG0852350.1 methyltransferase domain-containing protein [Streptomyces spinoverrucosus]